MWKKHDQFYEITSLENGDTTTTKPSSVRYEPTADSISNVIYVNATYIRETGIKLSNKAQSYMDRMNTNDKMILIPKIKSNQFNTLKQEWTYFEEREFLPKSAKFKNLIIIVEKPVFSNLPTSSLLVNNPKIVVELIRKHKLTVRFGSLTNGLLSVEVKINNMLTKKMILVISTVLSIVTSLLLFIVMNSVYFYHRRRVHFLERLAGEGLLVIHKK